MLGFVYILLSVLFGCMLCRLLFQDFKNVIETTELPAFLIRLPAWYLTGSLLMTWMVYLVSYLFQNSAKPMLFGNLFTMLFVAGFVGVYGFVSHRKSQHEF